MDEHIYGTCPECGSDNVEYEERNDIDGSEYEEIWYCCECGCCYSEYYEARPTGFEIREHGNKNNQ